VGSDHGVQSAQTADGIFRFELEVSGQDLAGGVVLKADQSEGGATALEPIVAAGIGEGYLSIFLARGDESRNRGSAVRKVTQFVNATEAERLSAPNNFARSPKESGHQPETRGVC
jgi:hypothetical protein